MNVLDTLGRPVRDLRISVTDRCNFRCVYCMPKEVFGHEYRFLPRRELLTFEEIERIARVFVDLGVRKLRITGGEPLLRRDLEVLVAQLAGLGDDLDFMGWRDRVLYPFSERLDRQGIATGATFIATAGQYVPARIASIAGTPSSRTQMSNSFQVLWL